MTTTLTSVASAAIIGGDLIIGLSDGSIINCGRVQGPQGLKGDQGPMGATGRAGADGNTIHTVSGIPDTTLGKDGDYAIDSRVWNIYGPRSAGQWGTATPLRGNRKGEPPTGRKEPIFGNEPIGEGGGSGGKRYYNTANLRLAGKTKPPTGGERELSDDPALHRIDVPGGNIIPEGDQLVYQADLNDWVYQSLSALDDALPIEKYEGDLPDEGKYNGDMALHNDSLWIYLDNNWIEVGGAVDPTDFPHITYSNVAPSEPDKADLWFNSNADELTLYIYSGTEWIPAAPPVSLDGIEQDVRFISEVTGQLNRQVGALGRVTHDQENRITELENAPPISIDPEPDPRLPYRLGTDKAAKGGVAAIELVDAEDNYSNVHIVGINGIKTESTISGINIDGQGLLDSMLKAFPFVQRATQYKSGQQWEQGKVLLYSEQGDLRQWPDLISLSIAVSSDLIGFDALPAEWTACNSAYLKVFTHDMRLIAWHNVERIRKLVNDVPEIDVALGASQGDCPEADKTVDATPYIYELIGILYN